MKKFRIIQEVAIASVNVCMFAGVILGMIVSSYTHEPTHVAMCVVVFLALSPVVGWSAIGVYWRVTTISTERYPHPAIGKTRITVNGKDV